VERRLFGFEDSNYWRAIFFTNATFARRLKLAILVKIILSNSQIKKQLLYLKHVSYSK